MRAWTIGVASLLAAAAAQGAVIGTITASSSAPTTYTIGQSNFSGTNGTGGLDSNNYSDHWPCPGEVFTAPISGNLTSITVKGGNNMGGGYITGNTIGFNILIGSATYNASSNNYSITPIPGAWDNVQGTCGSATDYYTITFTTPIAVTAGSTYVYTLRNGSVTNGTTTTTPGGWLGLARSTSDAYAGGTAVTRNDSVSVVPLSYDYTFYANIQSVPEPASLALLGLSSLALITRRRQA